MHVTIKASLAGTSAIGSVVSCSWWNFYFIPILFDPSSTAYIVVVYLIYASSKQNRVFEALTLKYGLLRGTVMNKQREDLVSAYELTYAFQWVNPLVRLGKYTKTTVYSVSRYVEHHSCKTVSNKIIVLIFTKKTSYGDNLKYIPFLRAAWARKLWINYTLTLGQCLNNSIDNFSRQLNHPRGSSGRQVLLVFWQFG